MIQPFNLLLVEDEPSLARVIKHSLEKKGYAVELAADGEKAYSLFRNAKFELCIIDVMLPSTDGFALARQIRANDTIVPILFLTARTADEDVLEGYRIGGNDYLKKPFNLEELFFRVNELLRRGNSMVQYADEHCQIGKYSFMPNKQTLRFRDQDEIKLSNRESALLHMLYLGKNAILDRKHVLLTLWGEDNFFNTRTMDVFVTKLRKHLKLDTTIEILNIRGRGYKLIC
jgi:two-component system, OmpR family, response regulator TrcR